MPFYDWGGFGLFNFLGTQRGEFPLIRSAPHPRPRVQVAGPVPDRHTRTAGNVPEFVKVKENEPQNTDFIIFLCPPHPLPGLSLRFLLVNVVQCPPLSVTPAPVYLHSDLFSAPPGCNRGYY